MTRFHRISFFGRLSVLLLCSAAASAQFQARLTGTVQDTTGAVLAGAKTQARNLATGVVQETLTNESGIYVFHSLAPGEYELRCEAAGFKAFLQGRLLLETGATRTLDVTMEIGAVSEVVEVTGQAPLLNSESATVGQFIERTTVLNMPFSSRRIGSLARLAGAVAYRREDGNLATPQFSMAGGRSENQMWLTDGAATQNAQLGSPQSVLNPPAEAMQEIKMETSNVGAEFGRAGGGLILMTTRSGTNQHHGAVYEFFRNDKLDARTFFAAEKAPFRFNIFGFSAGGPIVRNRTFFFANYEGDRRRSGTTLSGILVPHMPERTGNFSNRRDLVVRDPAANAPFPGNIIPASRFDRVGRIMATLYPEPNVPGSDITRAPSSNFFANVSDPLTKHFLTARVDHTLSAKDMLFVRAFRGSQPNETRPINPNTFADTRNNVIRPSQMQFLGNWTRNVSAGLFIETRFLFDRRRNNTASGGASSGKNREFGLREVNPDFFPLISVAGLSNLGRDGQRRAQTHNVRHFLHNLTWIKGSHQVKTGFELRYSRSKDDNDSLAGGQFAFADRATGSGLAELLLGRVNSAQFNDNDALDLRSDYWGLFIQDNWKVTSKLTLNLGLRWDLDTPRRER